AFQRPSRSARRHPPGRLRILQSSTDRAAPALGRRRVSLPLGLRLHRVYSSGPSAFPRPLRFSPFPSALPTWQGTYGRASTFSIVGLVPILFSRALTGRSGTRSG